MALIRGLKGNYPCPICFVPTEEQSDLTAQFNLRTSQHAQAAVQTARSLNVEDGDNYLKDLGLRKLDVRVCLLRFFHP